MSDIEKLCKRIIIINHGEIVYDGLLSKIKDKYIKEKHITIKSEDVLKPLKLEGCKVMRTSEHSMEIEVDLKKQDIDKVIDHVLEKFRIADITIADPPIEEIIKEIYRK